MNMFKYSYTVNCIECELYSFIDHKSHLGPVRSDPPSGQQL